MLKVGDKIVVYSNGMVKRDPIRIAEIIRLTATRAVYGTAAHHYVNIGNKPATAAEIAEATQTLRIRAARNDAHKAKVAADAADLKCQLRSRIMGALEHREDWRKMPIEQLEQMAAWLDAAEKEAKGTP